MLDGRGFPAIYVTPLCGRFSWLHLHTFLLDTTGYVDLQPTHSTVRCSCGYSRLCLTLCCYVAVDLPITAGPLPGTLRHLARGTVVAPLFGCCYGYYVAGGGVLQLVIVVVANFTVTGYYVVTILLPVDGDAFVPVTPACALRTLVVTLGYVIYSRT